MRCLTHFCIAFLASSHAARIDDFQNLAVGKIWKYETVSTGLGDVGWSAESTVVEISIPSGTTGPDSASFQILVTVTNIYHREGNAQPGQPRDTTVDTVYSPYTHLHQCAKILATSRVSCRDGRGVTTGYLDEPFLSHAYPHPRPLQLGIADYNFRRLDSAEYNGDTLGFFRYDSGQGPAMGCFTGQIPSCVQVGFTYLDSVGFVGFSSGSYNYIGGGDRRVRLIEYISRPFSFSLIPSSVRLAQPFAGSHGDIPAAYNAAGRRIRMDHESRIRTPNFNLFSVTR